MHYDLHTLPPERLDRVLRIDRTEHIDSEFYRKAGYRIVGLVDQSVREWPIAETAIVMGKPLVA